MSLNRHVFAKISKYPFGGKIIELTDEEIQQYKDDGYVVEEYADGGESRCPEGYVFYNGQCVKWQEPEIIETDKNTGYNAATGEISQDTRPGSIENNGWWTEHEKYHHLQNSGGGMSTAGFLGQRPNNIVASDQAMGNYYNRRDTELEAQTDAMIKADPNLQFIPRNKLQGFTEGFPGANALMYQDPTTVEGEARVREKQFKKDAISMFPKKQNGGYIDVELNDNEVEQYKAGGYVVEEYADGGESKCPEGMVPDGKGGCIEISSVFNEQEEFEKTLPKTEPKYYDKEGNLLETVPDYGTIYVTGKDDPKYKEYQDRLKFYNKAKKLHNDEGIKEWTREVASTKRVYDSQKNNPSTWSADEISNTKKRYEDLKGQKELYTDYRGDYKSERHTSQLPTIDWNEVTFKKDYGTHFADRWNFGLKEGIQSGGYDDGYDQVDKKWGALLNEALKTTVRPTKYFRGEGHIKPVFTYPSLNVKVLDEDLLKEKSPSTPTTLKAQDPDEIYGEHSFRTGNRVVNRVLTPAEPEFTPLPTRPLEDIEITTSTPNSLIERPVVNTTKRYDKNTGKWIEGSDNRSDYEVAIDKALWEWAQKNKYKDGGEVQEKNGYEYKKDGDKYLTRKKGSKNWTESSGKALASIKYNIYGEGENPQTPAEKETAIINRMRSSFRDDEIFWSTEYDKLSPKEQKIHDYSSQLKSGETTHDPKSAEGKAFEAYAKKIASPEAWMKLMPQTMGQVFDPSNDPKKFKSIKKSWGNVTPADIETTQDRGSSFDGLTNEDVQFATEQKQYTDNIYANAKARGVQNDENSRLLQNQQREQAKFASGVDPNTGKALTPWEITGQTSDQYYKDLKDSGRDAILDYSGIKTLAELSGIAPVARVINDPKKTWEGVKQTGSDLWSASSVRGDDLLGNDPDPKYFSDKNPYTGKEYWTGVDETFDALAVAGPLVGALGKGSRLAKPFYNKVATGNSSLPLAWKLEKPMESYADVAKIHKNLKSKSGSKLAKEEQNIMAGFVSDPFHLDEQKGLIRKIVDRNPTDLSKINLPVTRVEGYHGITTKMPNKIGAKFNYPEGQPRSWSLGYMEAATGHKGRQRFIIPSKYSKDLNFTKIDYADPQLQKGFNKVSKTKYGHINDAPHVSNFIDEAELVGNAPDGYRIIGRTKDDGFENLIIKPIKNKNRKLATKTKDASYTEELNRSFDDAFPTRTKEELDRIKIHKLDQQKLVKSWEDMYKTQDAINVSELKMKPTNLPYRDGGEVMELTDKQIKDYRAKGYTVIID